MSDREALAAALERDTYDPGDSVVPLADFALILAAARERLAQLPEKCGTCEGSRWVDGGHRGAPTSEVCPNCHGSGKVYPAELIERIADILYEQRSRRTMWREDWKLNAVAVLDALNEETP